MKTRSAFDRACKAIAVGVVLTLFAASCGGASEPTETGDPAAQDAASDAAVAESSDTSGEDGDKLIAKLGSQDAAVDATLASMELGYSNAQVLQGIEMATIEASGMISGTAPAGPALGLIDLGSLKSSSASLDSKPVKRPARQQDLVPIEQLRESAADGAAHNEFGNRVLLWISIMLKSGESPQMIIERLIFGDFDPATPAPAATATPVPESTESAASDTEPEIAESNDRLEFSGPFAAAYGLVPEPGDITLTDLFWASTDGPDAVLKASAGFLGQSPRGLGADATVSCLSLQFDFEIPSVGSYEWAGQGMAQGFWEDITCPAEGFPSPTEPLSVDVTANFDGAELVLTLVDAEGTSATVTLPLRESEES